MTTRTTIPRHHRAARAHRSWDRTQGRPDPAGGSRVEWFLLGVFAVFTGAALAGYAAFGANPARLAGLPPSAMRFYATSFTFFAQAHVWLAGAVLAVILVRRAGTRWVGLLAAVYAISLSMELAGTTVGIPFGAYRYSALLGPAWWGHVPVVIPLSWFCMALPSWALSRAMVPRAGSVLRVGIASLILLGWDLSLDPAMSHATRYWVWSQPGPFYGMPLSNLLGWYVTGVLLMSVFAALRADSWLRAVPVHLLAVYWATNLLLPIGIDAAAGLVGAVVAGGLPALLVGWRILARGAVARRIPSEELA
jgi:uncharacterized membrane protein